MTNDALVLMLLKLLDIPMRLSLFERGTRSNNANPTVDDFTLCKYCESFEIKRKHWRVDEAKVEARCERHTFKFTGKGGQAAGWVLMSGDVVVDFGTYERPYPINSGLETVWAEPRFKLSAIRGA